MEFLVIDDNKPFRDATCMLIEDDGHHGQPAASGEAGLTLWPKINLTPFSWT